MMWNYGYGAPMMGHGGTIGFHLAGMIFWGIILIVVVVAAMRLLRGGKHSIWHQCHGGSALNVLRERYARGEIEKAEYEERKKVLSE